MPALVLLTFPSAGKSQILPVSTQARSQNGCYRACALLLLTFWRPVRVPVRIAEIDAQDADRSAELIYSSLYLGWEPKQNLCWHYNGPLISMAANVAECIWSNKSQRSGQSMMSSGNDWHILEMSCKRWDRALECDNRLGSPSERQSAGPVAASINKSTLPASVDLET